MVSELVLFAVDKIDPNPYRLLDQYPLVQRKLEALLRSIDEVGLFEGIIGRRHGVDRVQLAFGHHRKEAARIHGLTVLPIIIRELTDQQMIQFLGRENGEDYDTDFSVLMATWAAAHRFLADTTGSDPKGIDIAGLLGWVIDRDDRDNPQLDHTSRGCQAARALIAAGYMTANDLAGIPVRSACEVVERALRRIEQIERMAKKTGRDASEVEDAKVTIGRAAAVAAGKVREGALTVREVSGAVDAEAFRLAGGAQKASPLFATFGVALANNIGRMLRADSANARLDAIEQVLAQVSFAEDRQTIAHLDFELEELAVRAEAWRKRLNDKPAPRRAPLVRIARGGDDGE